VAKLAEWLLVNQNNKTFNVTKVAIIGIAVLLALMLVTAFIFSSNFEYGSTTPASSTIKPKALKTSAGSDASKLSSHESVYQNTGSQNNNAFLIEKGSIITTENLPFKATFSKEANKALVFEIGNQSISFTPEIAAAHKDGLRDDKGNSVIASEAKQSQTTVSKNRVLYPDVYQNTDLERIVTSDGLKQNYILNAPGHPNSFSEHIGTNLSVKIQNDGSLIYYEGSAGIATKVIATSPKPHLTDAKGQVVGLSYALLRDKLTISLPSLKGLSYPITVDPSVFIRGSQWPF